MAEPSRAEILFELVIGLKRSGQVDRARQISNQALAFAPALGPMHPVDKSTETNANGS